MKVVLLSEDYSRELTSSILWLNGKGLEITCFRMAAYQMDGKLLIDFQQIIPLKEAEEYQVKLRNKQLVEHTARLARVPWNGEYYANFGDTGYRSWEDARKFGFICAGGGEWFSRTLKLLTPGSRVWVNCPGSGYVGVGIVSGEPVVAGEFRVETDQGSCLYLDVGNINPKLRANATDAEKAERFVPIEWIETVSEAKAIREAGLFGNQNSVAKPTAASWPTTVARLKLAFGLDD